MVGAIAICIEGRGSTVRRAQTTNVYVKLSVDGRDLAYGTGERCRRIGWRGGSDGSDARSVWRTAEDGP